MTAAGTYAVALLSVYLGYDLFRLGASGAFKLTASGQAGNVGVESVAPGLAMAAFGMIIAVVALFRLVGSGPKPPKQ